MKRSLVAVAVLASFVGCMGCSSSAAEDEALDDDTSSEGALTVANTADDATQSILALFASSQTHLMSVAAYRGNTPIGAWQISEGKDRGLVARLEDGQGTLVAELGIVFEPGAKKIRTVGLGFAEKSGTRTARATLGQLRDDMDRATRAVPEIDTPAGLAKADCDLSDARMRIAKGLFDVVVGFLEASASEIAFGACPVTFGGGCIGGLVVLGDGLYRTASGVAELAGAMDECGA